MLPGYANKTAVDAQLRPILPQYVSGIAGVSRPGHCGCDATERPAITGLRFARVARVRFVPDARTVLRRPVLDIATTRVYRLLFRLVFRARHDPWG